MSLLVKICGLSEERHVADAIEAGAGAVGFVFAESPRQVTPQTARAISAAVPGNVKRVAVMLHPDQEDWLAVLDQFEPDVLQADAKHLDRLDVPGHIERWPVYREGGPRPDTAGSYVYEGPKSGRGETVNWSVAAEVARRGRMILAGGLNAGNVASAVHKVRPFGVDASSSLESSPGRKDSGLIQRFIVAATAAEKNL